MDKEEYNKPDFKEIVNLIFESGMLTRLKRSGDLLVNNPDGENVSDHIFRAMLIGYFLAKIEKADENKVIKMLLFHDLPEARILEMNKVASRYFDREKAEKNAFFDQVAHLPDYISDEVSSLIKEHEERKSKEAILSKDADYLEAALTAKEAIEKGINMQDWIDNVEKALKTDSAKRLLQTIKTSSSNDWWKNLKYIPDSNRGEKKF